MQTSAAVSGSLVEIVCFGLPTNYFASYADEIEAGIRELNWREVQLLDVDGKLVK